jgi:hypothetical protein
MKQQQEVVENLQRSLESTSAQLSECQQQLLAKEQNLKDLGDKVQLLS